MVEARMIDGPTLCRYRRALGIRQQDLADALGVTQAAISLIESGRMAISHSIQKDLWAIYDKRGMKPRLGAFLDSEASIGAGMAPVSVTLPVAAWTQRLDLMDDPTSRPAVDLVTLRLEIGTRAIALSMRETSPHWKRDEVLVFAFVGVERCKPGDLCVLSPTANMKGASSVIARVVRPKGMSQTARRFELIQPEGPSIPATADAVRSVARCVYRACYI